MNPVQKHLTGIFPKGEIKKYMKYCIIPQAVPVVASTHLAVSALSNPLSIGRRGT
jgi:hypothetical protein